MSLLHKKLNNRIIETHYLKIGTFYFLDHLVISEIKEGAHIDLNSSEEFFKIAKDFFFDNRPFGYIANRINNFTISPLDLANYILKLKNLESFCAVTYNNHFDDMNIAIEKRFHKKPFYNTEDIEDAICWTKNIISQI